MNTINPELYIDQPQTVLNIVDQIDMIEGPVAPPEPYDFHETFNVPVNRAEKRRIERNGGNEGVWNHTDRYINAVGGYVSKLPHSDREAAVESFIDELIVANNMVPEYAKSTIPTIIELADTLSDLHMVGRQVDTITARARTTADRFAIAAQYAEPIDETIPYQAQVREATWRTAFYLSQGIHNPDGLLPTIVDELEQGVYDEHIALEICTGTENDLDIKQLLDFARHMAGDQADWLDLMLSRPNLLPGHFWQAVNQRRRQIIQNIGVHSNNIEQNFGDNIVGFGDDALQQIDRLKHSMLVKTREFRLGTAAVRHARGSHKRTRSKPAVSPATDTATAEDSTETASVPLPVAETVFDYSRGLPANTTVSDYLKSYAKHNPKFEQALTDCITHIAASFNEPDKRNGFKKVAASSNRPIALWEFKPMEASGVGKGAGRILASSRIFFVEQDSTIHLVEVFDRSKLSERLKALGIRG